MSDIAIAVRGMGKRYELGGARPDSLRAALANGLRGLGRRRPAPPSFWALRDVSFDIREGEVVGIIGRNGAGKSTLLKILARITEPTEGRATIHGRVASLLEVGTGFHPELTGRENIFLNGAILGMKRAEIAQKFDEIVAFAEVEKFLDTAVKHYSSGMYVRLAFAVAAHLEPDTLVVDEVLAVGDAAFQKKCLGRMQDVAHRSGRTVLFVSHNMTAVKSLCERIIWLDKGAVALDGEATTVASRYLTSQTAGGSSRTWLSQTDAPGIDEVRLRRVAILSHNNDTGEIDVDTPFAVEVDFWNKVPNATWHVNIVVSTIDGECIFCIPSPESVHPEGLRRVRCEVPAPLLNNGSYELAVQFVRDESFMVFQSPDPLSLTVEDVARPLGAWQGKWPGLVRPRFQWETGPLDLTQDTAVGSDG